MKNVQAEIQVESIRCNLCGQDDAQVLYRFGRDNLLSPETVSPDISSIEIFPAIVKCQKCGLVYVNPRWTFPEGFMPYSAQAEQDYFELTRQKRIIAFDALIRHDQRLSPKRALRALDVGCGDGCLLERCQLAGIDCEGFEVSAALIEALQRKFGEEKIHSGDLGLLPLGRYDCVFLINVIEHLPDPKLTLGQIYNLLKPGGRVFIHAPNMGGLPARLSGRRWHQIEPLGHLFYFTHATLAELLKMTGFIPGRSFYLKSSSPVKSMLQLVFNMLGWQVDNGLGIIARRPLG